MVQSSEQCLPLSHLCCGHNRLFWRPHRGLPSDDAHAVWRVPSLVETTARKGGEGVEEVVSGYVQGRQGTLHQRWQGAADNTTKWTVSEHTAGSPMVGTPIKLVQRPIRLKLIKEPICPVRTPLKLQTRPWTMQIDWTADLQTSSCASTEIHL